MKFLYRLSDKAIVAIGAVNPRVDHEIAIGPGVYGKDPEFYTIDINGDVQPKSQEEVDAILQVRADIEAQAKDDQAQIKADQAEIMPDLDTMLDKADAMVGAGPDVIEVIKDHAKMIYQMRTGKVS